MPSGTSTVVVSVRSAVTSSSHRSLPAGDAAGSSAAAASLGSAVASGALGVSSSTGVASTTSLVRSSTSAS
jgi:hypothetical protein